MNAVDIVKEYYEHFNANSREGMLSLLDTQIRHEPNQGNPRIGLEKFKEFMAHMDECYEETLSDMVFFSEPNNERVAVEFIVNGVYKKRDSEDLPPAKNQKYVLPAAAFLELKQGKITRISTYYNLPLWISLVSA